MINQLVNNKDELVVMDLVVIVVSVIPICNEVVMENEVVPYVFVKILKL
jgi:hypothetical protein